MTITKLQKFTRMLWHFLIFCTFWLNSENIHGIVVDWLPEFHKIDNDDKTPLEANRQRTGFQRGLMANRKRWLPEGSYVTMSRLLPQEISFLLLPKRKKIKKERNAKSPAQPPPQPVI